MKNALLRLLCLLAGLLPLAPQPGALAQTLPSYEIEFEAGPVWQSRNDVQIPNDQTGTRFSLADLAGKGPWPAGRAYLTWNINQRHGLRVLLAPFSLTETGSVSDAVSFAGETFQPGTPISATYKFSSWRVSYRYRFTRRQDLDLWVGFTGEAARCQDRTATGRAIQQGHRLGLRPPPASFRRLAPDPGRPSPFRFRRLGRWAGAGFRFFPEIRL